MRIIFATSVPLTQQHEAIMYMQTIATKYPIEKLDLSAIYGNSNYSNNSLAENTKKIQTPEQLEQYIQKLLAQDSVLVITDILIPNLKRIYPILKKYNLKIVTINKEIMGGWLIRQGQISQPLRRNNWKPRLKSQLMLNPAAASLIHQIKYGSCRYDYILASADLQPEAGKKFVQIHHVKYDEYLEAKNSENIIQDKYILCIDCGLTRHPMLKGCKDPLNEASYLKMLNAYFSLLEQQTGFQVVISPHPKVRYDENTFEGRKIIYGKTSQLVQHCEYVISHGSTSLINAILARKPIKILTSEEIENSGSNSMMCYGLGFAKMLNAEVVDLAHPKMDEFSMDVKAYEAFEQQYLLNLQKKDCSNKELILEFLETIKP